MEALGAIAIVVAFLVGVVVFVIWITRYTNRRMANQFTLLGRTLNLQVLLPQKEGKTWTHRYPSLDGAIDGRQFQCFMYVIGQGKNQRVYTGFNLQCNNPKEYTLQVYRESVLSKIDKAFGGRDIQIENADFDKRFVLKANEEAFAREVFDYYLCDRFQRAYAAFKGEFKLFENQISYREMLVVTTNGRRERFKQVIHLATALAEKIETL